MKKRVIWMVLSCLMVVALILASCAPAAPAEEEEVVAEGPEMVKVRLTKVDLA